jgi:hypothetical protein
MDSVRQRMYGEWRYGYLKQEALSSLTGETMISSATESPTDNPFMLDAIICKSLLNSYQLKTNKTERMGEIVEVYHK